MKEHFKISAKNLGAMALEDYCPRCFYIKLKLANKLPFQLFPGIFSSLDAYQKKCLHYMIDKGWHKPSIEPSDSFLSQYGRIKTYHKAPHWSKFKLLYKDLNITLSGEMDTIFELVDGSFVINDNKTAKYTKNQDKLLPMYEVQLNGYKAICEGARQFYPVSDLFLTYFEPQTEEEDAARKARPDGFDISFDPRVIRIEKDHALIGNLLEEVRILYDMEKPPEGRKGCKDCESMDNMKAYL